MDVFWLLQTLTLSLLFAISAATTEASGWDSESDTEEEEDEISGGGLGEEVSRSTEQGESGFPWWILGVAASALLIVVVIISVTTYKVCQRRRSLYTAPVAQTMKDAV